MNRRLVTTVVCPRGHKILTVTADANGYQIRTEHVSVGAPSRRGDHTAVTDRRRYGGMSGPLRPPTPGEFYGIGPACSSCNTDFDVNLNDLWEWATAGRRRVVVTPRP